MRNIYFYEIAGQKRTADPLRVLRVMWDCLPTYKQTVDLYSEGVGKPDRLHETMDLQGQLVMATRQAFDLPELSVERGEGFLDEEVLEVLAGFHEWLKKNNQGTASEDSKPTLPSVSESVS